MYKVLNNGTEIYNSVIEELVLIDPVVELEENCAGSFSFVVPPDHPYYDSILKRKSVIQVYQDDELIFSGVPIETEVDFYKQKKVFCEGELSYFNDSIQRPARYNNMTVRGLLEAFISNHNDQVENEKRFVVGQVTVKDSNNSIFCYSNMESTMQCLKEDLVDDLGGYFSIRHEGGFKYIDYLEEPLNVNPQVIRLGENLIDFRSNIDSADIATAIIPLGTKLDESPVDGLEVRLDISSVNDGKDYVFSQSAVDNYGWIYKTVEWDNVTTPERLKQKGEQYLSDIQFENMIVEANAIDLHFVDATEERFKLHDRIRVISEPHGLDRYFTLTKQTINLTSPENDAITLGKEERIALSSKTSKTDEAIYKTIESIVPTSKILQQARDNATALINGGASNGYISIDVDSRGRGELLIMDQPSKEDADKVWRWNLNGLGYSSNGYSGRYGTAMTMDGTIVAEMIAGEQIVGVGLKSNNDGGDYIDITNGDIYGGSGSGEHGYLTFSANTDEGNGVAMMGFNFLKLVSGGKVEIESTEVESRGNIKTSGGVTSEFVNTKSYYADNHAGVDATFSIQHVYIDGDFRDLTLIFKSGILITAYY